MNSAIPISLRERRQWLVWRRERQPGDKKDRKVPYYCNGNRRAGEQGSPADRAALATFDEAHAAMLAMKASGLGFAFLPGDGLIGIDLDHMRDPETGARSARALAIVEACDSYTEVSPSGTGLHLYVEGETETFKSNDIGVEVFCGRQFFTVTGEHLEGTPNEVNPIAPEALRRLKATVEQARRRPDTQPTTVHTSALDGQAKVESALAYVSPECGYDDWIKIGMAIHAELGAGALHVWNAWSAKSAKYPGEKVLRGHWKSFTPGAVTGATLYGLAGEAGWRAPRQANAHIPPALAIPDFGPERPEWATDLNDLHQIRGAEAVAGQIQAALIPVHTQAPPAPEKPNLGDSGQPHTWNAGRHAERRPEFRPLQREIEAGELYPVDALGELLGGAAHVLHDIVRAPMAICGQSVLGAAALAVQAHADVQIDGRRMPVSLDLLTLADSGDRKSAVDKIALYPVHRREKRLIDEYEPTRRDYDRELDAWKASRADALRSGGKERNKAAIARALADVGDEPEAPLAPVLLASEPTFEGLAKLLANGQPSIGLFSAEGGQFIGGHAMNADNRLKTSAGMSSLWDGAPLDRVRAGDGASKLYGRRMSCHLMTQPRVAAELLGSELINEQGLIARFLIAQPESTAGSRVYVERNPEEAPEIRAYTGRLLTLMEAPLPIREGTRNELAPRALPLHTSARRLWIGFHNAVEREIVGEFAPIKAFAAKAAEHVLRLAGVLCLVEDLNAAEIDEATLRRAIALGEFYLSEALRLAGSAQADPELTAAQRLYGWLIGNDKRAITLIEIYRNGPAHVRSASRARELLRLLEQHGHVSALAGGLEYEGTLRREAWRVHRQGEE